MSSKKDDSKEAKKGPKSSYAFAAEELLTEDETPPAISHETYQGLMAQLDASEQKANENWEKFLRLQAEMDNVLKRKTREVAEAHEYSIKKFASDLLPVIDNLERALEQKTPDENPTLRTGVELTLKLFQGLLEKYGLKAINPLGEVFDPNTQEAMSMQVSDQQPGTVVQVLQKGYQLHERLLRPALVVVAKAK